MCVCVCNYVPTHQLQISSGYTYIDECLWLLLFFFEEYGVGIVEICCCFFAGKHTHTHTRPDKVEYDGREGVVKGHRKLMAPPILHGISSDTLDRCVRLCVFVSVCVTEE